MNWKNCKLLVLCVIIDLTTTSFYDTTYVQFVSLFPSLLMIIRSIIEKNGSWHFQFKWSSQVVSLSLCRIYSFFFLIKSGLDERCWRDTHLSAFCISPTTKLKPWKWIISAHFFTSSAHLFTCLSFLFLVYFAI
jgi:hypothetical protein